MVSNYGIMENSFLILYLFYIRINIYINVSQYDNILIHLPYFPVSNSDVGLTLCIITEEWELQHYLSQFFEIDYKYDDDQKISTVHDVHW